MDTKTYESKFINVYGSKMHYLEQGKGDPILFLHGIPTSSYLWRNILPNIPHGRCVAPDLIGMGKSDKPNLLYRVFDHIRYIEGFIDALQLKNITLVLHGWGSVIGLDYAMRHENKVKSLIFYESHLRPISKWEMLTLPLQELATTFHSLDQTTDLILNTDYFMDKIFPTGLLKKLAPEEKAHYAEPFQNAQSRQVLLQYLKDFPIGTKQTDVSELMANYSSRLLHSTIPKLMLYTIPGFNTTVDTLMWAKDNLKNISLVDIGEDLHYAQETNPETISEEITHFLKKINQGAVTA